MELTSVGSILLHTIWKNKGVNVKTHTNFLENYVQIVKEYLQYSQKKFIVNKIPSENEEVRPEMAGC